MNDEKYTPNYAVLPILKYLPKKTIWCPFDTKNSEFVLALQENNFDVVYSHIMTGQDFFEYEPPIWDVIFSNPPFSDKAEVFKRWLNFQWFVIKRYNYLIFNKISVKKFG